MMRLFASRTRRLVKREEFEAALQKLPVCCNVYPPVDRLLWVVAALPVGSVIFEVHGLAQVVGV